VKLSFSAPIAFLVVAILVFDAAPAYPQAPGSERSPGGLFGGEDARRRVSHKLDFSLSLVEANDSDVPAELFRIGPADTMLGGYSTMFMGTGEYRWKGSHVEVGATGASVVRRYNQLQDVRVVSHTAGVGLSARLGGRTTLLANQTAAYSPSYLYGLFPSDAVSTPGHTVPAAPDYAIGDSESYFYGTTLTLTHGLTVRNRLSATGEFQYTDYLHEVGTRHDLNSRGIRGEFSRNLARSTAAGIGYRYRTGKFGYVAEATETEPGVSATEHRVDVGLEYLRPLSAIRQMVFEVSVGSSIMNTPVPTDAAVGAGRFYRLSSDVAVTWQFTNSWQARGTFRRGLEYVAQLSEPVFVDGLSGELGGFITPRIDVAGSARYSSGASAFNRSALTFDTYGADLRIRYGLTRSLAVYGQYLYYYYDFQRNTQLPTGIPLGLERNGIRVGLTLWVPVLRR
jgi:hypothetical protein